MSMTNEIQPVGRIGAGFSAALEIGCHSRHSRVGPQRRQKGKGLTVARQTSIITRPPSTFTG